MSYSAHIYSPDDEPELPDEFAALGEQLFDDAEALAKRFPAERRPEFPDAPPRRRIPRRIAAAAIVAATVGGLVGSIQWREPDAPTDVTPAVAEVSPAPGAPAKHVPSRLPTPQIVPVALFQTLSEAEQEALLDLMEDEELDQASLSI